MSQSRQTVSRLFYVHTDASMAVFLVVGALIELACGALLGGDIQLYLANPAAGFMACAALICVWSIYRFERRYN